MKTIIFLTMLAMSSFCQAQTATATANGVTATATSGKSSKTKTTSSTVSTSVSIQNSDDTYSLTAKFDSFKKEKLQKLLSENLEKEHMSQKGETISWKKTDGNEVAYGVTLTNEKLKITVDKDLVSGKTAKKFEALGEKISESLR
jgi:hypothetical protein